MCKVSIGPGVQFLDLLAVPSTEIPEMEGFCTRNVQIGNGGLGLMPWNWGYEGIAEGYLGSL